MKQKRQGWCTKQIITFDNNLTTQFISESQHTHAVLTRSSNFQECERDMSFSAI